MASTQETGQTADATQPTYDLLILTDATISMGNYLNSLTASLPEIFRISALTGSFTNIGVVAYRDYCGGKLTEWSGWHGPDGNTTQEELFSFCRALQPDAGGDWPEATKTGLARAYEVMNRQPGRKTIIILYADAPPHMPVTGGNNRQREIDALLKPDAYGGHGKLFADWVTATQAFKGCAMVFSLIMSPLVDTFAPYLYLTHNTGGRTFQFESLTSDGISKLTVGVLLAWMGATKSGAKNTTTLTVNTKGYYNVDDIPNVTSEKVTLSEKFWVRVDEKTEIAKTNANIVTRSVTLNDIGDVVKARRDPTDLSKRYKADPEYRKLVVTQLEKIIEENVKAMAVNPIFGTLWRTVCNDRENEAREGLLSAFGRKVDELKDPEMKQWLEESYDYAGEILEVIQSVPEDQKYPCVFLDPTQEFVHATTGEADGDHGETGGGCITKFTRAELLEIGRSCDYKILRRLGKVLTQLTYVSRKEDLPAHVKNVSGEECPKIPVALTTQEYNRKFWKILLHLVLPGTMLSPRPAALLAALSLKMGIVPLQDSADQEMIHYRSKWNTLEIPETWNANCLSLLLDADKSYRARIADGTTKSDESCLISDSDRALFSALVDYKLLELNLATTLSARVGWTPSKDKTSLGPIAICKQCRFPRSVTIMAANSICGLCATGGCKCYACARSDDHGERVLKNVTADDSEKTEATWVECFAKECRAQYVVYNPQALNVRAKCFYCRHNPMCEHKPGPAPTVDCSKCLSRILWPTEYRPANMDLGGWLCPACDSGKVTIVETETTAQALAAENGTAWLLRNDDSKISTPLQGGSLFKTISAAGTEYFADKVAVLPALTTTDSLNLTIGGKQVRNTPDLVDSLGSWIARRRAQQGTCSLCFSSAKKAAIRPACGRRGCTQLICDGCRGDWYGLNAPGFLLNTAALHCPFCRRLPAARAVRQFGIAALPGLSDAVTEAGEWVYAWCRLGGHARRFAERVCAAGAPANIQGWSCDECLRARREREGRLGEVEADVRIVKCPGCDTPTEKMGGCNHITCEVPGCGTHWCWICRWKNDTVNDVYDHMMREHGGWYEEEEQQQMFEDDEDDELEEH